MIHNDITIFFPQKDLIYNVKHSFKILSSFITLQQKMSKITFKILDCIDCASLFLDQIKSSHLSVVMVFASGRIKFNAN
jgi:hypothetical protein